MEKPVNIALLSLCNGHVFRGVESFATYFTRYFNKINNSSTILLQGGRLSQEDDPDCVKNLDVHTEDLSGDESFMGKLTTKLGLHKIDFDVKRFYEKAVKTISDLDGINFVFPSNQKPLYLKKLFRKYNINNCIVIGVGHARVPKDLNQYDAFVALNPPDFNIIKNARIPVELIPNGIDFNMFDLVDKEKADDFKNKIEEQYGVMPRPIIIIVSALVPPKRVHLGINVLKFMNQGTILICGSGPLRNKLREHAADIMGNDKLKKVIFIDAMAYENMPFVYRLSDVFLHPAHKGEAFGNVIIEALASGLPVVVNNDSTRAYMVKNYSYLCDVTDSNYVAKKITKFYNEKDKLSLISKAIARQYDWTLITERYHRFLSGINF